MAEVVQMPRVARGSSLRGLRRPSRKQRYMAFLSYSHQDSAIADWLHESLEEYRVPRRLVGRLTDQGAVPKRLSPIFRDRHELAASPDLGEEIEEAIAASRFLIVLCSPAAARSRWINEEIACFKRLHREDRVLAAIIDGEPFASELPGREAEECFPEALRVEYDRNGQPTDERAEPVAADLREQGDGRKIALLKLAAGMLGVGLDDLAQREAQRRHRRLYAITAASVAGMILASGLAYTAFDARDAAQDQRREAEGLIGFMLGDLREKLEPVGRLDVLDAVGARALEYFEKQDKSDLSDDALAQQWKALTLMGEIAASRGDMDGALRRYRQALAGTAEALRRAPGDPQRMYDHAQSVYFVGSIAMERGLIDEAAAQFREYRRLADRMIAAEPDNPKWRLEGVYAATNLGIVELEQAQYAQAAETFAASVGAMDLLISTNPGNREYQQLLSEALAYHADALDYAGHLDPAIRQRERQLALLTPDLAQARPDAEVRQKAMIANRHLALLRFLRGQNDVAQNHARSAAELGRLLVELEPTNVDWLGRAAGTQLNQGTILLRSGKLADARMVVDDACSKIDQLVARDPTVINWRDSNRRCLGLRAELKLLSGSKNEAMLLARQMLDAIRSDRARDASHGFALGQAHKLVGDILWRTGDRTGAIAAWRDGLLAWPKATIETPRQMAERGEMLRGIGRRAEGTKIRSQLATKGYRQSISNRVGI